MKIVSDFQDFYDCMQGMGIDKKIHYERMTDIKFNILVPSDHFPDSGIKFLNYRSVYISGKWERNKSVVKSFLLLAGKSYPFVYLESNETYYWTYKDFENYYLEKYDYTIEEINNSKNTNSSMSSEKQSIKDYLRQTKRHFDNVLPKNKIVEAHRLLSSPIILMNHVCTTDERYVTINPCLKDIGFSKVLQPHEVFQDLSMFIGAELNPEKETVEISDKDKVVGHGFDNKSFKHRT